MPLVNTTVRARILVGIDSLGQWVAAGYSYHGDDGYVHPRNLLDVDELAPLVSYYWIDADVPLTCDLPLLTGGVSHAAYVTD